MCASIFAAHPGVPLQRNARRRVAQLSSGPRSGHMRAIAAAWATCAWSTQAWALRAGALCLEPPAAAGRVCLPLPLLRDAHPGGSHARDGAVTRRAARAARALRLAPGYCHAPPERARRCRACQARRAGGAHVRGAPARGFGARDLRYDAQTQTRCSRRLDAETRALSAACSRAHGPHGPPAQRLMGPPHDPLLIWSTDALCAARSDAARGTQARGARGSRAAARGGSGGVAEDSGRDQGSAG